MSSNFSGQNVLKFSQTKSYKKRPHLSSSTNQSNITASSNLTIIYYNIQGLDLKKLTYIIEYIERNPTTIFVIAEHWFSSFTYLEYSHLYIASSPRPSNSRLIGHENGGLAILSSLPKSQITILESHEYFLTFKFNQLTFSTVYLPPRLSNQQLTPIFQSISTSDIIIGDVNVRFGTAYQDDRITSPERAQYLYTNLLPIGFSHIPSGTNSRNDHVFSKIPLSWTYHWLEKALVNTDHGMMAITLPLTCTRPTQSRPTGEHRFAFSLLSQSSVSITLCRLWDFTVNDPLSEIISYTFTNISSTKDRDAVQEVIDTVYGLFVEELETICALCLPKYDPERVKYQKDNSIILSQQCTNSQAVRAFKRSQRNYAAEQVVKPRDDQLTALQEATSHYRKLYQSTDYQEPSLSTFTYPSYYTGGIAYEDVQKVIKEYPTSRAGGPDRFDTRLFKSLLHSKTFVLTLTELMKLFQYTATTPSNWNLSRLHLLLKNQDSPYVDQTRPIALTQILRRLFEKLLLRQWLSQPWAQLSDCQAGFRKGWSTYSHIITSDELSRHPKTDVSIFLDLKSAFDKVSHYQLIEILKNRQCPNENIHIIKSLMMNNCRSTVSVNKSDQSLPFPRNQGVFQGSILSPFLFNLYIDSLATQLEEIVPEIVVLLFADDIVLKGHHVDNLQLALDICFQWSISSSMVWNLSKCGVMGISHSLYLGNQIIPKVSRYKYLGLPHHRQGIDWNNHLQSATSKAHKLMSHIQLKSQLWSPGTRLIIWKTFIRPIIEYALPLITLWLSRQNPKVKKHLTNVLTEFHMKSLQFIFGYKQPRALLENASGLGTMSNRLQTLESSLVLHIRRLASTNPLLKLMQQYVLSSSSHSILHLLKSTELLNKFTERNSSTRRPISWTSFARSQRIKSTLSIPGVLQHFVRPSARSRGLVDKSLYAPQGILSKALAWRRNTAFTRGLCAGCNAPFNRRHVDSCLKYMLPHVFANVYNDKKFIASRKIIDEELLEKGYQGHFTPLDHLLNVQDFEAFNNIFDRLRELIFHGSSGSTIPSRP